MARDYRADQVGSLLRPPELRRARAEFQQNRISRAELTELEDRLVDEALEMQRQVGIDVLSDGEGK